MSFAYMQVGIAGDGVSQAAAFIQNNYIPLPFLVMLLLQFLSMLVDRFVMLHAYIGCCVSVCKSVSFTYT